MRLRYDNIIIWIGQQYERFFNHLILRIWRWVYLDGPFIIVSCRFGAPYSLTKIPSLRAGMIEKIERNIAKMGSYEAFRKAIITQRDEAEVALKSKMKKWYTLQKQVEFLNKTKLGGG